MISSDPIQVIDNAVDDPSIRLLVNSGLGDPQLIALTPDDAMALGLDILELDVTFYEEHPQQFSNWADRLCGVSSYIAATLPSDPSIFRLWCFIASRPGFEDVDLNAGRRQQLMQVRDLVDAMLSNDEASRIR